MLLVAASVVLAGCGSTRPQASAADGQSPRHVVRGKVVGAAGQVPRLGEVHVLDRAGQIARHVAVATDGSFALELPEPIDPIVRIDVTALGHQPQTFVVATADTAAPALTASIQLATYPRAEPLAPSVVFAEPAAKQANAPLAAQPDGTYALDVTLPDGTYRYQLAGVAAGQKVSGTAPYTYDGKAAMATLEVRGQHGHIAFAPSLWPAASAASAQVTIAPAHSATETLTSIYTTWDTVASQVGPDMTAELRASLVSHSKQMLALADANRDPLVKHFALSVAFGFSDLAAPRGEPTTGPSAAERARATELLAQVPPSDPQWGILETMYGVIRAAGGYDANAAYAKAYVNGHPNIGPVTIYLALELYHGDEAHRRAILKVPDRIRLGDKFTQIAGFFDPDRILKPGRPMPAFSAPRLDGDGAWTPASFAGSVYLIDAWATWCAPCVAEMPTLQALHERYGAKLKILSLSIDESKDDPVQFRKTRFPMPWDHGYLGPDRHGAFFKALALSGTMIPFHVLVGADGTILATSPELDLHALPAMLDPLLR